MFKKILIASRGDNAEGVAAKPNRVAGAARQGDWAEAPMFKKILIANRGDNAQGVAAKPNRVAGAAR
jgi:acetyl/propionyl-CoA carboxylase alpha subunit